MHKYVRLNSYSIFRITFKIFENCKMFKQLQFKKLLYKILTQILKEYSIFDGISERVPCAI